MISLFWHGAVPYGIDIDREWLAFAGYNLKRHQAEGSLMLSNAEALPFADNTFDIVASNFVLEHVSDPFRVIVEMARVLKPGGLLYINCPNYIFPYEGHYRMFWFPLLPKKLGHLYLKLRGRDSRYLDHIFYIKANSILKYVRRAGLNIKVNFVEASLSNPALVVDSKMRLIASILKILHIPAAAVNFCSPQVSILAEKIIAGQQPLSGITGLW